MRRLYERICISCVLVLFCPSFFPVEPDPYSGTDILNRVYNNRTVKVPVWVLYEAPPGADPEIWIAPAERLLAVARYIMEASVFGWDVSYTPYDRRRGVAEFFSAHPVFPLPADSITLEETQRNGANLEAIAVYTMPPDRARWYDQWEASKYRTFGGTGCGPLDDEFSGFTRAVEDAVKEAVRAYGRSIENNKPKEIKALVRLAGKPRIAIKAGQYYADLRVRIYIQEVLPYTLY